MKYKSKIGTIGIIVLSIIPIIIWFVVRNGNYGFNNFKTLTYSLGQMAALLGTSIFALTFLMTTRSKFLEEYFGGLDKMYFTHHLMGAIAFILLLFHPLLLLIKYIPNNLKQAALFLLPTSSLSNLPYTLGIVALFLMIIFLILTFFVKLQYQKWKITHKMMGIIFLIATFHFFFVTTDITFYPVLRYYMMFVSIIGLASYGYIELIKPQIVKRYQYGVYEVDKATSSITSLTLSPISESINFIPGQFIYIKLESDKISKEQHPFTIASSPQKDGKIRLSIKSLGDYTNIISSLDKGVKVDIEGPYGRFNYQTHQDKSQIWIAGGIGITPFLSFAQHLSKNHSFNNKVELYYSTNNKDEASFLDELKGYQTQNDKLKIIPFFTNEKGKLNADIIEKYSQDIKNKHFYICGPPSMMENITLGLKRKGVPESQIHFEKFNMK